VGDGQLAVAVRFLHGRGEDLAGDHWQSGVAYDGAILDHDLDVVAPLADLLLALTLVWCSSAWFLRGQLDGQGRGLWRARIDLEVPCRGRGPPGVHAALLVDRRLTM
jgi:hypothetical protein